MKRFTLSCVSRETGKESTDIIVADDERSAYEQVSAKGKMVAKVQNVVDLAQQAKQLVPPPKRQPTIHPTTSASGAGIFLCIVGLFILVSAFFIPVLHATLVALFGGFLFVSGVVLNSVAHTRHAIAIRLDALCNKHSVQSEPKGE